MYSASLACAPENLWLSIGLNFGLFTVFVVTLVGAPILEQGDRRVVLGFIRHPLTAWRSR